MKGGLTITITWRLFASTKIRSANHFYSHKGVLSGQVTTRLVTLKTPSDRTNTDNCTPIMQQSMLSPKVLKRGGMVVDRELGKWKGMKS